MPDSHDVPQSPDLSSESSDPAPPDRPPEAIEPPPVTEPASHPLAHPLAQFWQQTSDRIHQIKHHLPHVSLPQISLPHVSLPQISLPQVSLPQVSLPQVSLPISLPISLPNQLLPAEQITQSIANWFQVSEAEVAEMLATIRAEIPTTEALLLGKPQAGKSSIVRGLTGVSAEIVGQGFRPHTQHTERYAYPSSELPLLIFTDTVGLGDIDQETNGIVEELLNDLQQTPATIGANHKPESESKQELELEQKPESEQKTRARVLILTVKINDFATDTLRQVAQQLRQSHPEIPCLLAVTCLHEVYPAATNSPSDHPAYPPHLPEVDRCFTAIQHTFAGLFDRAVLIDFTLEADGYTPIFYGLDAFKTAIADLLPAAEARAIYQLLEGDTGQQIGNLYRDVGRRYLTAFSIMAATIAAVPLPFATMPVLTTLQVSMVTLLGRLYGQTLTPAQAGGVISAIAGGFVAQAIGRELVKFVPGLGSVIAASWAAAYTWSLGEGACVYFGDLMGGKKPNPQQIQTVMQASFKLAQARFETLNLPAK